MSPVDLILNPPTPGGASLRCVSRMRRLLGSLSLLAMFAASPARTATTPPVPSTPADAIALLRWCWESRDVTRYHELFTQNFRYFYTFGDSSGAAYQTTPWTRLDELASATNLFVGGSTPRAPASSITLTFTSGPEFLPSPGGLGYPWRQRFVARWALDIACTDGSTLQSGGQSMWFLVRGDSAAIPQELKDRGFSPDSSRWYVERWLEEVSTAPIVVAPSEANGRAGTMIRVQVMAQDPDGEPITSLSVETSVNASFYPAADNSAGTFVWITRPTDVGLHGVTFRADNSLTGLATTTLNVLPANLPPIPSLVVTSPAGAGPLRVIADASGSSDPDGQIVSYRFDFGDGTVAGPQSSPTTAHAYGTGGIWPLTLSVTDDGGATASVTVRDTVTALPVASIVLSPSTGVAPLAVSADASRSSAVGSIASYRFDFGDGTVVGPQPGPIATHTYGVGNWTATVRVTDSYGVTASASTTIAVTTVPDPVAALPNLVRNPSFEVDAAGWGPFYGSTNERVAGGYDGLYALQMTGSSAIDWGFGVNDSPDWIRLTTAAGKRYRFSARVFSTASHGTARIRVREYLLSTKALLGQISSFGVRLSSSWQTVVVDYTTLSAGSSLDLQVKENPLVAGEVFLTDDISIRDITGVTGLTAAEGEIESEPNAGVLAFRSAVYPSPIQANAALTFATTRPGALRVDILDLAGRQVRRLADEIESLPGMHVLTIDRTRDDGKRMHPGLYFYRVVAAEGRLTGRFVLLK